jgi:hypothetical protein
MTVLIKYPRQTKSRNKIFFEKKELTNLDWCKWAGWSDTDINFERTYYRVVFRLRDRQPVELFSKIFETSLRYIEHETITPEPYRKEYICKEYAGALTGEKGKWFTENVYPFLLDQKKKNYAARLLGYRPESKNFSDWTPDELTRYLATALDGDGSFNLYLGKNVTSIRAILCSSDIQYLSDIKYLAEKKLGIIFKIAEATTYMTQKGERTSYQLYMDGGRKHPMHQGFFQSLVRDGVMTLDRKKQKVQRFVN